MSIELKNPKSLLEKADALSTYVQEMYLTHKMHMERIFDLAHKKASKLAFEITNEIEDREL